MDHCKWTKRGCRASWISASSFAIILSLLMPWNSASAAETFRFYAPTSTAAPDDYPDVFCEADLVIMGLSDNTTYEVYDLDDLGSAPIAAGKVSRFEKATITPLNLLSNGHYQIETSKMTLAYLGDDCLGEESGGSFFYPTANGRSFIGADFVINIPVLGENNEFIIFAYEDTEVTIENTNGNVVTDHQMTANSYVKPIGLIPETFYTVRSTGHIALQSNARNGHTTVPGQITGNLSSCYNDASTNFLFATWGENKKKEMVVVAHEDAKITLRDLKDDKAQETKVDLIKGETWRQLSKEAKPEYWLLQTEAGKRVAIRTGLQDDGTGVASLADDISFSSGFNANSFYLNSMAQGGVAFISENNTTVDFTDQNGTIRSTLNANEHRDLSPNTDWIIESDLPILVETIGGAEGSNGIELNDFGSFIPPSFTLDANSNGVDDHKEDLDKDGNPNACDLDCDGDGIPNDQDNCRYDVGDADNNGCPEGQGDRDGDGILDGDDACPDSPEDMDGDNDEDGCPETMDDMDGDGIADDIDNCVRTYNPNQEDSDGDGVGDACEDGDTDSGDSDTDSEGALPGVGATGTGALFSCSTGSIGERSNPLFELIVRFMLP